MTRLLVADDERPVVDGISHIVRRDLAGEFEIAGTASSGREAVEKALLLSPDLVLMDVRMPGLSGLDAVRELRARGSRTFVILITAYERFDIAREAVELGVLDYLLKPVSKDTLSRSLRSALAIIERKAEADRREMEGKEREEAMQGLAEAALVEAVMLGVKSRSEIDHYRSVLGLPEPYILAAAAALSPPLGSLAREAEVESLFESLRSTLRYKTCAIVGPRLQGICAFLLPLRDSSEGDESIRSLRAAIESTHASDLGRGRLRLGFGSVRPFEEASESWAEALGALFHPSEGEGDATMYDSSPEESFDDDDAFLDAIASPSPERASQAFERILARLRASPSPSYADRHRFAALMLMAARDLRKRGALKGGLAVAAMDQSTLIEAADGATFEMVARSRFAVLAEAALACPHRQTSLDAAIERIREDFGKALTLELVASDLGVSPARLSRLFVEGTGKGFSDFLVEYRIERAKEMLLEPDAAIKQVSVACGYLDPNYFSRLFKKVTGLTPSAYSAAGSEGNDEAR